MPVKFNIIIPKIVEKEKLAEFFNSVYTGYKGKLFTSPTIEIYAPNVSNIVKIIPVNDDFSELGKYRSAISTFLLNGGRNPSLRIYYPPAVYGHPTIDFETRYIYARTESEAKEAQARWDDMLGFAKLLMKQSEAEYFYGGLESFGDAADVDNEDLAVIYGPEDVIIEKVRGFIKSHTKIDLKRVETMSIIEQAAKLRIKEGEYELICFFEIKPNSIIYDNKGNPLIRVAGSVKNGQEPGEDLK
jgi:hypothetical protein